MGVGYFDEDLAQEKLVEDVAAKHFEEFAFGMAAAKFEPLADYMETAGIGSGQGLTEGKHGIAGVERVECGSVVVAIAVDVRTGQKKAIAFVHGPEITGHPDLFAGRVLLGVRTKVAQRPVEGAKDHRETKTH